LTWTYGEPLLWIASYSSDPGPLPNGFSNWFVWQYSDTGRINGIEEYVSLDAINPNHTSQFFEPKVGGPVKLTNQNHM